MGDVTVPFGLPYPEATDLVRDGAADIEALAEGVNDQLALGFVFVGTRYYTSSGTFVKADPFGDSSFAGAKLRAIRVRMVGGGGGGGGSVSAGANCGAGGNAGAYAESFITDIASLSATETVTRGAGGAGTVGAAGSAGGQSSFAALVTAQGGNGSGEGFEAFSLGSASVTLVSGTGNLTFAGAAGEMGQFQKNSGVASTTFLFGGAGAASHFGGGTGRVFNNTGQAGTAFGSGGGGSSTQETGARAGGAGAAGIVIVDVFA